MTDSRILTARASGSVGKNALVPRHLAEIATPKDRILDFGAGPCYIHTRDLKGRGFNVYAYDLAWAHKNADELPLDCLAWHMVLEFRDELPFTIVMASNVINVQETEAALLHTTQQLRNAAGWIRGKHAPARILLNYPDEPRKLGWDLRKMRDWLTNKGFGVEPQNLGKGVMLFELKS